MTTIFDWNLKLIYTVMVMVYGFYIIFKLENCFEIFVKYLKWCILYIVNLDNQISYNKIK